MQILRSGKNNYVHECTECGCIFAYGKLETEPVQTGIQEYKYSIKCPECNKKQTVDLFSRRTFRNGEFNIDGEE